MKSCRRLNAVIIILGLWNLIGGLIHLVFENSLLENQTSYKGFLLIENLLITFVFAYFVYKIFFASWDEKVVAIKTNLIFWIVFSISFAIFQPEITSLDTIRDFIPIPQKYVLLVVGIIAVFLSVASYRDVKRLNHN
jgi:hypothetical protein